MSDITNAAVEAATMTEEPEQIEATAITIEEAEGYELPSTYEEGTPPSCAVPDRGRRREAGRMAEGKRTRGSDQDQRGTGMGRSEETDRSRRQQRDHQGHRRDPRGHRSNVGPGHLQDRLIRRSRT